MRDDPARAASDVARAVTHGSTDSLGGPAVRAFPTIGRFPAVDHVPRGRLAGDTLVAVAAPTGGLVEPIEPDDPLAVRAPAPA